MTRIVASIVFSLFGCLTFGQEINPSMVIPPSPEMASLSKYISIPVEKYKGISQINIPFYTVDNKEFFRSGRSINAVMLRPIFG